MDEETTEGGVTVERRGRPTDYRPEFCQRAAELCIAGATDFEVAQDLECDVRTLYRWKAAHPGFCQALKVGKELADDRVEAALFHRSVGYSHPAVKIMQNSGVPLIVPYTEHVPPDPSAAKLWLTNRRPEEWREKVIQELTGKDGGPIEIADARERNLLLLKQVANRIIGDTAAGSASADPGRTDSAGDA